MYIGRAYTKKRRKTKWKNKSVALGFPFSKWEIVYGKENSTLEGNVCLPKHVNEIKKGRRSMGLQNYGRWQGFKGCLCALKEREREREMRGG